MATKSTESMVFSLCFMGFIVSVSWSLYGYLLGDLFIQVCRVLVSSSHGSNIRSSPLSAPLKFFSFFAPPGAKRHRGAAKHPAAATLRQVRVKLSDVVYSCEAVPG